MLPNASEGSLTSTSGTGMAVGDTVLAAIALDLDDTGGDGFRAISAWPALFLSTELPRDAKLHVSAPAGPSLGTSRLGTFIRCGVPSISSAGRSVRRRWLRAGEDSFDASAVEREPGELSSPGNSWITTLSDGIFREMVSPICLSFI
ncbi:MAG TPA: hypothetical protein VLO11_08450, partial [Luteolibacter sp.]|nr:hypothetical protein [Luteolibacter sp.]